MQVFFLFWVVICMYGAWQEELNQTLARGLGYDDDYDDFEKEFFFQMLVIVSDKIESAPLTISRTRGSRPSK